MDFKTRLFLLVYLARNYGTSLIQAIGCILVMYGQYFSWGLPVPLRHPHQTQDFAAAYETFPGLYCPPGHS